jgi:dihydrofolate reductase
MRTEVEIRRIIASVVLTLDGYMEGPSGEGDLEWSMPFVEDILADAVDVLGTETDAILLGRITYQGFSEYWPFEQGELADLMNTPPKYVFTSPGTLGETPWGSYANAYVIDRDVEARVRELKRHDGKDMVILASGSLVSSFLGLGLVDEIRLLVVPVALGAGKPYLRGITSPIGFELADVKRYPKGSVRLTYHPSR